ncbi:hypothetical protein [Yoonia sp.]|uniref:hypothetical protein n=1 Tax=Yoonia sp. TaxID=2212373 RepID=UPI00358E82EC
MTRALVDKICTTFPGATAADPTTELDSWKVRGKMFPCFSDRNDGICVKTDSIDTSGNVTSQIRVVVNGGLGPFVSSMAVYTKT